MGMKDILRRAVLTGIVASGLGATPNTQEPKQPAPSVLHSNSENFHADNKWAGVELTGLDGLNIVTEKNDEDIFGKDCLGKVKEDGYMSAKDSSTDRSDGTDGTKRQYSISSNASMVQMKYREDGTYPVVFSLNESTIGENVTNTGGKQTVESIDELHLLSFAVHDQADLAKLQRFVLENLPKFISSKLPPAEKKKVVEAWTNLSCLTASNYEALNGLPGKPKRTIFSKEEEKAFRDGILRAMQKANTPPPAMIKKGQTR